MAKITQADVEYVAGLAHLTLDEAVKARLAKEMGDVLAYMDKLNELDTSAVQPMMHAMELLNVYREDEAGVSLDREQALANAPHTDGAYFLAPRFLDTE